MEISHEYAHGKLATEPVSCPDGSHLKMRWHDMHHGSTGERILGVWVNVGFNPEDWTGMGTWYSLKKLTLLGDGSVHRGLNIVGQDWYGPHAIDRNEKGPTSTTECGD